MLRALAVAFLLVFAPASVAAQTPLSTLYVNESYDPRANPYQDLERAIDRAAAENKRILIVVGGNWCGWCQVLDSFFVQHPDVRAAFEDAFVMVKVNASRQNDNAAFRSGFPPSAGYPDFFVLDSNGAFVRQQSNVALEDGEDYSRARMLAFARRWR
jgi:thioredoxin-related protein